jgi:hypothetical protein
LGVGATTTAGGIGVVRGFGAAVFAGVWVVGGFGAAVRADAGVGFGTGFCAGGGPTRIRARTVASARPSASAATKRTACRPAGSFNRTEKVTPLFQCAPSATSSWDVPSMTTQTWSGGDPAR